MDGFVGFEVEVGNAIAARAIQFSRISLSDPRLSAFGSSLGERDAPRTRSRRSLSGFGVGVDCLLEGVWMSVTIRLLSFVCRLCLSLFANYELRITND
ncbi:MAG: hypothetical protein SVX43_03465 [Cyanobacteriota bacterium]|nr:hypothetical protein [Cyanobacteriota bacterium]